MLTVYPIVEGHGEVAAVPILLRRIAEELGRPGEVSVLTPHRVPRGRMLADAGGHLERAMELGARKLQVAPGTGAILVLLDADDDCPAEVAPAILHRLRRQRPDIPCSVVLASREYEAWILAAATSLRGRHRVSRDASPPPDPEAIRDAKGYISHHLLVGGGVYSPSIDQPSMTATFSLAEARACSSFDKLMRDFEALLTAA